MIIDLKRYIDLRWLFDDRCYIHLRWSCFSRENLPDKVYLRLQHCGEENLYKVEFFRPMGLLTNGYSTALILDPPDADGGEWCSPSLVAHSQTFPSLRCTAPLVAGSSDIEKCFQYIICEVLSNSELIFVTTTQPAVVYFFRSGVLSSIENP